MTKLSNAVARALPQTVHITTWRDTAEGRVAFNAAGVIVRADGLILTNYHVVKDAISLEIVTFDNQIFIGQVVASDDKADVALVQIKAHTPLPTVTFAPADSLRRGDMVFLIGSPMGYRFSVCHGMVGHTNRDRPDWYSIPLLQTDAPTNVGNSGGGVFDDTGRLVGLHVSAAAGALGISFSLRLDGVLTIANHLLQEIGQNLLI